MRRRRCVGAIIGALVASSCATAGGGATTDVASGPTAGGTTCPTLASAPGELTQGTGLTFYVITHGIPGPFWSVVQKGAKQAGRDLGVTVLYESSNDDAHEQSLLFQAD